jgi:hypothetical protein
MGSHPERGWEPCQCPFLEHVAGALCDHDQFVAHRGRCGVADRAIQLPTRATDLTMATDGLDEAGHGDHPFGIRYLVLNVLLDNASIATDIPVKSRRTARAGYVNQCSPELPAATPGTGSGCLAKPPIAQDQSRALQLGFDPNPFDVAFEANGLAR